MPSWTQADVADLAHYVGRSRDAALPDRVLTAAINAGVIPAGMVPVSGSWRLAAVEHPDLYNVLHRLAADTYGYRKIMICEMSTVVQADLLTVRFTAQEWEELFRSCIVPVVEHGQAPLQDGRVTFGSHDPGNPNIRSVAERIQSVQPRLVYADRDIVSALQRVLIQNISLLGPLSNVRRPALKKVHLEADTGMGRAA